MHCGYYVCEFLRNNSRYTSNPKKVYKCVDATVNHLLDEELMNICNEFCCFILKEIFHKDGKYFDHDGELANPKYQDLVDIDMLELNNEYY
ncbi:hypothetical protein BDA96_10G078100 [Sorghum bicolor]|uniref:Uncharacterized protein n=1 Tax=Sorghum bicolor TaxID=4558 RepID=A0A921U026_SORBI|nr:hypothetical protein BDA96_10G078100 [Sorghum bicolor]